MYKYKDIYTCILRNTCLYLIYYIMYVYIYIHISKKDWLGHERQYIKVDQRRGFMNI